MKGGQRSAPCRDLASFRANSGSEYQVAGRFLFVMLAPQCSTCGQRGTVVPDALLALSAVAYTYIGVYSKLAASACHALAAKG